MLIIVSVLTSVILTSSISMFALYLWFKLKFSYWKSRNIPGPEPSFPFGTASKVIRREAMISTYLEDVYNEFSDEPYVGIYMLHKPILIVRDPMLATRILTKDAHHFDSRGFVCDEKNLLSNHLFAASGAQWRMLRSKLSPTFTSGKMKMMFRTMADVADVMQQYVAAPAREARDIDMKDVMVRYTTDVIGSCAFGVDCNSFTEKMSDFLKYGNRALDMSFMESITVAVHLFAPELRGLVSHPSFNKIDVRDFMVDVFNKTTNYREQHNVQRNDFLQLLIQLKNNKLTDDDGNLVRFADGKGLSENLLVAQLFIFFLAGFETSSTAASFAMHELAVNPTVQEKAREEVLRVVARHGDCTYDALMEMDYLTNVVDEILRKYPPLAMLFRRCTIPYDMPDSGARIDEGTLVFVPISAIQNDPKHFENPEAFQPERFSPSNRTKNINYVYMPFGQGPRYCIGQRFGMMQAKLGLAKMLLKYRISPCARTRHPIEYDPTGFTINPKGGLWLKISEYKKEV